MPMVALLPLIGTLASTGMGLFESHEQQGEQQQAMAQQEQMAQQEMNAQNSAMQQSQQQAAQQSAAQQLADKKNALQAAAPNAQEATGGGLTGTGSDSFISQLAGYGATSNANSTLGGLANNSWS